MICCDTCPWSPTCEETEAFEQDILGLDDWGEEYDDGNGR